MTAEQDRSLEIANWELLALQNEIRDLSLELASQRDDLNRQLETTGMVSGQGVYERMVIEEKIRVAEQRSAEVRILIQKLSAERD